MSADVRLDAREQLVAKLAADGRPDLLGASDAELILEAYDAWGEECVAHLLGDFAFGIGDESGRRLFCARDHFGVRPFYYARAGDGLVFGSSLDEVRRQGGVSTRLHEPAIADFLLFGFNQDPETTTFADVRSLPPGHCLVFEDGRVQIRRYWTLPIEEVRFRKAEEYCERFRDVLGEAVTDRLRGVGERAAILLSGGLDSPSIAAMATAGLHPARAGCHEGLRAYTIAYDKLIPHEERHYAGAVASHLGLPVEFVPVDGYRLFDKWERYHTPEPIDNPLWAVPVDLFARIAADGHRVVLNGEAGDAAAAPVEALPELLAPGSLAPLARDIVRFRREHGRWPPFGVAAWWRRTVRGEMAAQAAPRHLAICDKAFAKRVGAEERCRAHPDAGWAHHELQSPMWPWCSLTQGRAWTGADVEVRYPFLDLRLVSFMLSVPSVPWAYDKELMRTAMRGLLPDEVLRRRKAPLSDDPVAALMRRDGPPPMPQRSSAVWEFVDRKEFEKIYATGAERAREISRVISLAKWLEQFE